MVEDILILASSDGAKLAQEVESQLSAYGYTCLVDLKPMPPSEYDNAIKKHISDTRLTILVIINSDKHNIFNSAISYAANRGKSLLLTNDKDLNENHSGSLLVEELQNTDLLEEVSRRVFQKIGNPERTINSIQDSLDAEIEKIRIYSTVRQIDTIEAYQIYLSYDSSSHLSKLVNTRIKFLKSKLGKLFSFVPRMSFFVLIATILGSAGVFLGVEDNSKDVSKYSEFEKRMSKIENSYDDFIAEEKIISEIRQEWGEDVKEDTKVGRVNIENIENSPEVDLINEYFDSAAEMRVSQPDGDAHVELSRFGNKAAAKQYIVKNTYNKSGKIYGFNLVVFRAIDKDTSVISFAVRIIGLENTEEAYYTCKILKQASQDCYIPPR